MQSKIEWKSGRQFGVELELNSFSKRDFMKYPLEEGEIPDGSAELATVLQDELQDRIEISGWGHLANNKYWNIKPDRSCGMEICSSPMRGKWGLRRLVTGVRALRKDGRASVDERCSFHVTVSLADHLIRRSTGFKSSDTKATKFTFGDECYVASAKIRSLLAYWIKAEAVMLDAVHGHRKFHRYCEPLSLSGEIQVGSNLSLDELISIYGGYKYRTANIYHFKVERRPTIEYRIVGGDACLNEWNAFNWVRLFLWFTEVSLTTDYPVDYQPDNPWSGYAWWDPTDLLDFLKLRGTRYLSEDLIQLRNWFLATLYTNCNSGSENTPWSPEIRRKSFEQVNLLMREANISSDEIDYWLNPDNPDWIYYEN